MCVDAAWVGHFTSFVNDIVPAAGTQPTCVSTGLHCIAPRCSKQRAHTTIARAVKNSARTTTASSYMLPAVPPSRLLGGDPLPAPTLMVALTSRLLTPPFLLTLPAALVPSSCHCRIPSCHQPTIPHACNSTPQQACGCRRSRWVMQAPTT